MIECMLVRECVRVCVVLSTLLFCLYILRIISKTKSPKLPGLIESVIPNRVLQRYFTFYCVCQYYFSATLIASFLAFNLILRCAFGLFLLVLLYLHDSVK